RGRHACVDLQCHADRRGEGAGRIHAGIRSEARLTITAWPAFVSAAGNHRDSFAIMRRPLQILILNHIAAAGLARLPHESYVVGEHITEPDAILLRSADLHGRELPASLKAVGRAGAGTDNIPVAALSRRGVPVFNAPGGNA